MISKHVSRLSEPISGNGNENGNNKTNWHKSCQYVRFYLPMSPAMEEAVESSVGGLVPRRPGMLPNR